MQRIGLETLWLCAYVFSVLPRWFKYYVVENLFYFLLYYGIRYRMSVVKTCVTRFREKSERAGRDPSAVLPYAGRNLRGYAGPGAPDAGQRACCAEG